MNGNRLTSGLYQLSEWITRLAYLNILWILFTLFGLIIFGIFPATASVFAVIRHWIKGEEGMPIFKTFWSEYKANFISTQIIGYILVIIGAILYFDYHFFSGQEGIIFGGIKILTGSVIFIYILVVLYIFPVFVHFKLKLFEYIKNALLISLSQLLLSIVMFIGTGLLYYAFFSISGLLIIFGISLPAYWISWVAQHVLKKIELIKASKNA